MADNISRNIQNARTIEDIVNLLSILFTNLNNQNEMYYDMFLNPEPMELDLERYDENGELVTVVLPNVAKMRITTYSGEGNPNGSQVASPGALYIDTNSRGLYYKASGNDSYGWQLIWTTANLAPNVDYVTPTGDGSRLQNLSANSISSGTLTVPRGGTGASSLSGILKGNGTSPVSTAIAGTDYLAPSSLLGLIMYCPTPEIPEGWLICDGTVFDVRVRPELTQLKNKLGNRYGGDGVNTFGVPSLIGRYIKCGSTSAVGTTGSANVGAHVHQVSGYTNWDGAHTHNRGSMNITGSFTTGIHDRYYYADGCFYGYSDRSREAGDAWNGVRTVFDASRSWTGETSATPHNHYIDLTTTTGGSGSNEVDHTMLIPIMKY